MNLFLIIQARMTSTRLPGKVMLPLCGKTVLEIMLDRLNSFKNHIIIATTNDGSEQSIVKLCKKLHVNYYRGDTQNVLSRYYEAAVNFGASNNDIIIRCTSDCPLIDESLIQQGIDYFKQNDYDYVSNSLQRTYPRGLDYEIFNFNTLYLTFKNASLHSELEHVTPYIYTAHQFKIGHIIDTSNNSKFRLTLDEEDDYKVIQEIYKHLDCKTDFNYDTLIQVLKENPYLYKINAHVEQKKYTVSS